MTDELPQGPTPGGVPEGLHPEDDLAPYPAIPEIEIAAWDHTAPQDVPVPEEPDPDA